MCECVHATTESNSTGGCTYSPFPISLRAHHQPPAPPASLCRNEHETHSTRPIHNETHAPVTSHPNYYVRRWQASTATKECCRTPNAQGIFLHNCAVRRCDYWLPIFAAAVGRRRKPFHQHPTTPFHIITSNKHNITTTIRSQHNNTTQHNMTQHNTHTHTQHHNCRPAAGRHLRLADHRPSIDRSSIVHSFVRSFVR